MSLPKLPPENAFLHVINDHRNFAAAVSAWNEVGPPQGNPSGSKVVNGVLPGIGVLLQDALHLHCRNLIEFYMPRTPQVTDVVAADFGVPPLAPPLDAALEAYRDPISVHTEHITAWRDVQYRTAHAVTAVGKKIPGATRQRPDWNVHNTVLANHLLDALDRAATAATTWRKPFVELRAATRSLANNPHAGWPANLGEKNDVDAYLKSLGLRP